jgi:hypothetical protein
MELNYMNINRKTQTQNSVTKACIPAVNSSIELITRILENLNIYKQCMLDYFTLQSEIREPAQNDAALVKDGGYTLPGVIPFSQNQEIDSHKNEEMNVCIDEILQQKRMFFRVIEQDMAHSIKTFHEFKKNDLNFEEFSLILNGGIDLSLQPQKISHKPTHANKNVKIEVRKTLNNNSKK